MRERQVASQWVLLSVRSCELPTPRAQLDLDGVHVRGPVADGEDAVACGLGRRVLVLELHAQGDQLLAPPARAFLPLVQLGPLGLQPCEPRHEFRLQCCRVMLLVMPNTMVSILPTLICMTAAAMAL